HTHIQTHTHTNGILTKAAHPVDFIYQVHTSRHTQSHALTQPQPQTHTHTHTHTHTLNPCIDFLPSDFAVLPARLQSFISLLWLYRQREAEPTPVQLLANDTCDS